MPERPLAIATYAVSASVVAIVLGYIFGPTIFPDDQGFGAARKKGVVGLSNPANDCFINSVLQAFAGLQSFKDHLARECLLHVRRVDEVRQSESVDVRGENPVAAKGNESNTSQVPRDRGASRDLKDEIVTRGLKAKLDELCETTVYKKTISASDFVRVLEFAFGVYISRRQQDAQEFLHIVAERLCEEFHASHDASDAEGKTSKQDEDGAAPGEDEKSMSKAPEGLCVAEEDNVEPNEKLQLREEPMYSQPQEEDRRSVFPMEGKTESHIECQACHYKPKPNVSSFVTLTVNVPQKSSTTLDACLDGLLKVEYIEGWRCDRCRIQHSLRAKLQQLAQAQSTSSGDVERLKHEADLLDNALADPENLPANMKLCDTMPAPERRIAKHTRISTYPATLALHLSRSIFNSSSFSRKNSARVEFPEVLTLGGILQRRRYRLACLVTHRGGHNSGHYETYRRQDAIVHPVATQATQTQSEKQDATVAPLSPPQPPQSTSPPAAEAGGEKAVSEKGTSSPSVKSSAYRLNKGKKHCEDLAKNRWWCISDDKVRACRTSDVLGMQKEAYLLFYELQPADT